MRVTVPYQSDVVPELHHASHREYLFGEYRIMFSPMKMRELYDEWHTMFPTVAWVDGPTNGAMSPIHKGKVYWGKRALERTTEDVRAYVETIVKQDWEEYLDRYGLRKYYEAK